MQQVSISFHGYKNSVSFFWCSVWLISVLWYILGSRNSRAKSSPSMMPTTLFSIPHTTKWFLDPPTIVLFYLSSLLPVFSSLLLQLVQKSFARLLYNDFLRNARFNLAYLIVSSNWEFFTFFIMSNIFFPYCSSIDEAAKEKFTSYSSLSLDESYQSRDLEKVFRCFPFLLFLIPRENRVTARFFLFGRFHNNLRNRFMMLKCNQPL